MLGFVVFALGIAELALEVLDVIPLAPGFGDLSSDGPRGPTKLIRQRILFLCRKALRSLKDAALHIAGFLINTKLPECLRKLQLGFIMRAHNRFQRLRFN